MPMQGDPLAADEIALVKSWIEMGAPWPEEPKDRNAEQAKVDRLTALKKLEDRKAITEKDRQWWSYRKPVRPPVPAPKNTAAVWNPVDAFVVALQESEGLKPAPVASRAALIRRLYFDLIGLPPLPMKWTRLSATRRPNAYRKLMERLLDSRALRRALGPSLAGCRSLCR